MLPGHSTTTVVSDGHLMALAFITLNTTHESHKQTRWRYCTRTMEATQLRRQYTISPRCVLHQDLYKRRARLGPPRLHTAYSTRPNLSPSPARVTRQARFSLAFSILGCHTRGFNNRAIVCATLPGHPSPYLAGTSLPNDGLDHSPIAASENPLCFVDPNVRGLLDRVFGTIAAWIPLRSQNSVVAQQQSSPEREKYCKHWILHEETHLGYQAAAETNHTYIHKERLMCGFARSGL